MTMLNVYGEVYTKKGQEASVIAKEDDDFFTVYDVMKGVITPRDEPMDSRTSVGSTTFTLARRSKCKASVLEASSSTRLGTIKK